MCTLVRGGGAGPLRQDAPAPVELGFWNGFTGPDGRVMLGIVRTFNAANPDARVTLQRMDWGTYYNKLLVACTDGRGPDVFVSHASSLTRLVAAGIVDVADDVYTDAPIDLASGPPAHSPSDAPPLCDFAPVVLEQLRFGGHYMGLALDVHPQGLYVNTDLLAAAGITDVPRSAREFVAAARRLRTDTLWGFSLTNWRFNYFSLLPQYAGRLIGPAGEPTLDTPQNIAALETLVSFVRPDPLAPDPENNLGWVGFRQRKIAMVCDGVYMLGDLKRLSGLSYAAVPFPQFGPYPGTHGDSHVLCLRKGLPARSREAAVRFIRYLSSRSLAWADAGQVPARNSVRHTDAFRAMAVQYQMSLQLPYVQYPPRTPILFELQGEVDTAVERALRGRATPAQALAEAQVNALRFARRARLEQMAARENEAGAALTHTGRRGGGP